MSEQLPHDVFNNPNQEVSDKLAEWNKWSDKLEQTKRLEERLAKDDPDVVGDIESLGFEMTLAMGRDIIDDDPHVLLNLIQDAIRERAHKVEAEIAELRGVEFNPANPNT